MIRFSKALMENGQPNFADKLRYKKFRDEIFVCAEYITNNLEKEINKWNEKNNKDVKLENVVLKNPETGEVVVNQEWKQYLIDLILEAGLENIEVRNDPDAMFEKTIYEFFKDKETTYTLWEKEIFTSIYKQIKKTSLQAALNFQNSIKLMEKQKRRKTGISEISFRKEKFRESFKESFRPAGIDCSSIDNMEDWTVFLAGMIDITLPKIIRTTT